MDRTADNAETKYERILRHIEAMAVGTRISVRKIAKAMGVSEGTAYRAIKEAEEAGLVSTRERVGTVRVDNRRANIDKLTFAEVLNIVDGEVLGGSGGLAKTLSKFVIGAMELEAMVRYISPGSLLIVGNRIDAHAKALELGAGVLITGGFGTTPDIRKMADRLDLPIISSAYDTFAVASLINRAIYDRLIKKKIMLVEDLLPPEPRPVALRTGQTVRDWQRLLEETEHSRFPVVDDANRVVGMVTARDVLHAAPDQPIEKWMTRNPLTVTPQTSVAAAAHLMVWEGIELLPVVDARGKLLAVISRQDVLRALQSVQKQPQIGETFEDEIMAGFEEERDEEGRLQYRGRVTPQMTSRFGTASEGVLTTLMVQAAYGAVRLYKRGDLVLETISSYFLRPLQIDSEIVVKPRILEMSRKVGKADVEIYCQGNLAAKAVLSVQMIDSASV